MNYTSYKLGKTVLMNTKYEDGRGNWTVVVLLAYYANLLGKVTLTFPGILSRDEANDLVVNEIFLAGLKGSRAFSLRLVEDEPNLRTFSMADRKITLISDPGNP